MPACPHPDQGLITALQSRLRGREALCVAATAQSLGQFVLCTEGGHSSARKLKYPGSTHSKEAIEAMARLRMLAVVEYISTLQGN